MYNSFFIKAITVSVLALLTVWLVDYIVGPFSFNISEITTQKDNLFHVSASDKVFAKPDTASIVVSTVKEAKLVQNAQKLLNETNAKVIEAIKSLEISEDDIKTTSFNISPSYRYDPQTGRSSIDGYRAESSLEVRVKDFEKLNKLIDTATEAGANQVSNIQFTVDEKDEFVKQARQSAIEIAKQKARDIADETGIKLGKLVNIQVSESGGQEPPRLFMAESAKVGMGGGGSDVIAGTNEIQVQVTLSYVLE